MMIIKRDTSSLAIWRQANRPWVGRGNFRVQPQQNRAIYQGPVAPCILAIVDCEMDSSSVSFAAHIEAPYWVQYILHSKVDLEKM